MAANGDRGYYPPGDILPPRPLYGSSAYSPSSNYSPGLDSMASPQLVMSRYRSIAPPAEVFLDSLKSPLRNSMDSQPEPKPRNSPRLDINDSVAMHLLVETALGDSQEYDVLSFEEVEALKKETRMLTSRMESLTKKLALETKLRDAAMSLSRLNAKRRGLPESPKMNRGSISGRLSAGSVKDPAVLKAEADLAASARKCDDLTMELHRLDGRLRHVQTQLLRHTAGILQMTHGGPNNKSRMQPSLQDSVLRNGRPDSPASIDNYDLTRKRGYTATEVFDERSLYKSPENIDGLLDSFDPNRPRLPVLDQEALALQGLGITQMPPPPPAVDNKASETLLAVEGRLEELNSSLRNLIIAANPSQSQYPVGPNALSAQGAWVVEEQLDFLDQGLRDLAAEQTGLLSEQKNLQQLAKQARNEVEGRLEAINSQVYSIIDSSQQPDSEPYPPPPRVTGQGTEAQITYLDEALYAVRQLNEAYAQELVEARAKTSTDQAQTSRYDAVLTGLWTIILSEEEDRRQRKRQRRQQIAANPDSLEREEDLSPDEDGNPNEPFAIETFSQKVQWLVTKVSNLKDQQSILRRQIRQQRDLNSKSDAEREEQVADLTAQLNMAREQAASAERELTKCIDEMGRVQALDQQRGTQTSQALAAEQKARQEAEQVIATIQADLQTQLNIATAEREAAEARAKEATNALEAKDKELRELEGDVVRISTELTIAKAELDGAYGTRAQRAADAEWNPEVKKKLEDLNNRNKALSDEVEALQASKAAAEARVNELIESERTLKAELGGMATDYEAFTRDSIQMEKERESYEALIDSLRSEKEKLELELSDEKVRWLGMKSPGQQMLGGGPEMTSVRMLREDFRKMMRDRTAEGLKALRSEQEERRKLEALIRQLRKEQRSNAKA